MSQVFQGRYTAKAPGDATAVFLIGMRFNSLRGLGKTRSVVTAMPRILSFLGKHPEFGMLGFHQWFGRNTILVSYWRSAEDVQRFASDGSAPHAAAWRAFVKDIGDSPHVGIWHELYTIRPGDFEGVYDNMPAFGMARAGEQIKIGEGLRTSKQRMAGGRASIETVE